MSHTYQSTKVEKEVSQVLWTRGSSKFGEIIKHCVTGHGTHQTFWQQWCLRDGIFEVSLDHETSCFYGLLTTDPISTLVGLVALQLWWGLEAICPILSSSAIFSTFVQ